MTFATITTTRPAEGVAVITVTGDLDVYSAPALRTERIAAVNEGRYRQVVDLTAVPRVDSSGLGVIVGAWKRCEVRGGALALVTDPDGEVRRTDGRARCRAGVRDQASPGAAAGLPARDHLWRGTLMPRRKTSAIWLIVDNGRPLIDGAYASRMSAKSAAEEHAAATHPAPHYGSPPAEWRGEDLDRDRLWLPSWRGPGLVESAITVIRVPVRGGDA